VIKLESVHIEWARGIAQKLELDFQQKTFAISGPNGSGRCRSKCHPIYKRLNPNDLHIGWHLVSSCTSGGTSSAEPVVAAFRDLLDRFRCATCDSWVYVTPRRGSSESLRCTCDGISFNLKSKAK